MSYGNNAIAGAQSAKQASGQIMQAPSSTIGENIDRRISYLRIEIERLEGVRSQLRNGSSLLDVSIEDLRAAMNY